jgi:hypothetical protein
MSALRLRPGRYGGALLGEHLGQLLVIGWSVTQYTVFGAFGAITFMALSGIVLDRLRAATPATPSPPHGPPTGTA